MKTFYCHGQCKTDRPITERHSNATCRETVCITCHNITRKERAVANKIKKHEQIEEQQLCQRLERAARNKELDAVFDDKTLPKQAKRLKGNRMIEIDHVLEQRKIDRELQQ
jgi:hypothetical protein